MILEANDAPVLTGSVVTTTARGLWTAHLFVDSLEAVGPSVVLRSPGGFELHGTAKRESSAADTRTLFVVAGAGRLDTTLVTRKGYQSISVRVVIVDILTAAGERLSPTSDQALLGGILRHWTRLAGSAMRALDSIVNHLRATWRVLPDGSTYVGSLEYPEAEDDTAVDGTPDEGTDSLELAVEAPRLVAPCTYAGRKVDSVVHVLGEQTTTRLHFGKDRRQAWRDAIRKALPELDYLAQYSAKVVSQNGDGSLELLPDDLRIPPKSRVPIRYGIAGITITVAPGARCTLGWDAGDPDKPFAANFEPHHLKSIKVEASVDIVVEAPDIVAQKGRPLARVGDMVRVISSAPGTIAVGQITTGNQRHRG